MKTNYDVHITYDFMNDWGMPIQCGIAELRGFDCGCDEFIHSDCRRCFKDSIEWLMQEAREQLSAKEKAILSALEPQWKYIARDRHGRLWVYGLRPRKSAAVWMSDDFLGFSTFDHLFDMVKWEDEEPTSIQALLNRGTE